MSWWMTALICVFVFLCIVVFFAGIYFIYASITKRIIKRRYKTKNDIGRKRQDFWRSFCATGEATGIRVEPSNNDRAIMENMEIESDESDESEPREHRKVLGDYSYEPSKFTDEDYRKFREEVLS